MRLRCRSRPDPERNVGDRKVLAKVEPDDARERREVACGEQCKSEAVNFLTDRVVLLAELYDFAQLAFEELAALAQGDDLALADRNCTAAVGVRYVDVREQIGELFEEFRMILQVARYGIGCHVRSSRFSLRACRWFAPAFEYTKRRTRSRCGVRGRSCLRTP